MEQIDSNRCFDGQQLRYQHYSNVLNCDMVFSIYLPDCAAQRPVPVLYWLSGLTCTDQNFVTKAGAQQYASAYGIAIVAPDTSPRGDEVPDDPEGTYDFGLGAGFYVDATEAPWSTHYHMYEYVVRELPRIVNETFPVDGERLGIFGHSMGGHGALTIALRNPDQYQSVSAFSPIVSPSNCPWGQKALGRYLGEDRAVWKKHDACELVRQAEKHLPILVDQGTADGFLVEQLKTGLLIEAGIDSGYPMNIRMQAGFDHSYFFITSFMAEHMAFHHRYLTQGKATPAG